MADGDFASLKAAGTEALNAGRFGEAAERYEAAAKAAGNFDDRGAALSNASLARLRGGDADAALVAADGAALARPDWAKAHFRRGEALHALERWGDAEAAYAKAAGLDPKDASLAARRDLEAAAARGRPLVRQLAPGRDFAITARAGNPVEQQVFGASGMMQNFVYVVACGRTRECAVVDGCWDVRGILQHAHSLGLKVSAAVATHHHFDHVGGKPPPPYDALGITLPGARDLAEGGVPVYAHELDAAVIRRLNGVPEEMMRPVKDGDTLDVGSTASLKFVHTPGHTPGSMVVHVADDDGATEGGGSVLTGDTIFPGSCGRVDLEDSDASAMYDSLQRCRAAFCDQCRLYPGHAYGGPFTTVAKEKQNGLLRPMPKAQWMAMQGQ